MWCILDSTHIKKGRNYYIFCECLCGKQRFIRLVLGKLRSDKCNRRCVGIDSPHKLKSYGVWEGIIQRCYNKNNKSYKNYGGRGIITPEEWKQFKNFYRDMGERPKNKEIDRIDNQKGYSKENCRWVTRAENNRNHRRNVQVCIGGRMFCLLDACRILGVNYKTISGRWRKKTKTVEEFILLQIQKGNSSTARMSK